MTSAQKHFDKLSAKKQIERLKKLGCKVSIIETGLTKSGKGYQIDKLREGGSSSWYCFTVKDLKGLADKLTKGKNEKYNS